MGKKMLMIDEDRGLYFITHGWGLIPPESLEKQIRRVAIPLDLDKIEKLLDEIQKYIDSFDFIKSLFGELKQMETRYASYNITTIKQMLGIGDEQTR